MRSTVQREQEWDEQQQAYVLALDLYESLTCRGCGGYLPETTAPEADEGYIADAPIRCHHCTAISLMASQYREAQHPAALRFPVRRKGGSGGR